MSMLFIVNNERLSAENAIFGAAPGKRVCNFLSDTDQINVSSTSERWAMNLPSGENASCQVPVSSSSAPSLPSALPVAASHNSKGLDQTASAHNVLPSGDTARIVAWWSFFHNLFPVARSQQYTAWKSNKAYSRLPSIATEACRPRHGSRWIKRSLP